MLLLVVVVLLLLLHLLLLHLVLLCRVQNQRLVPMSNGRITGKNNRYLRQM